MSNKPIQGVRSISDATAVFSDNFQFGFKEMPPDMPKYIEKDRIIMSARHGMLRKLFALRKDHTGIYSSGFYLFDTLENASEFGDFVENDLKFFERPIILEPTSQLWHIAAAEDFASIESEQKVVRIQRWHVPETIDLEKLQEEWWPILREEAIKEGLTSAWLLAGADKNHPQLAVVLVTDGNPEEADKLEAESIQQLENWDSPSERIAKSLKGIKVFDRTSWIFMVWHPVVEGDTSKETAQWPVSPPLIGRE